MPDAPRQVKICDVSLRDGMQILNRHAVIPLASRLELAEALVRAGLPYIEVGSFVNPRVVPAMRDTTELLARMPPYDGQIAALAPTLEYVFVTPRFHFVHHSVDRRFSDNNFGFLLSIWDRLFGTYVPPEAVDENEPLGLDYANSKLRLLAGLPPPK